VIVDVSNSAISFFAKARLQWLGGRATLAVTTQPAAAALQRIALFLAREVRV